MKRLHGLLMLVAVIPLCGYTDCNYFSTVTIPAQDTQPPIVGTRMWIDGQERIDLWSSSYASASGSIVVVPFVYDGGGARTLTFGQAATVHCYNAQQHLGQATSIHYIQQSTSQTGSVGSSVSDGMYLIGSVSNLASFGSYCYDGFELESVSYGWGVWGTDFAGLGAGTDHQITYTPSASFVAQEMESAAQEMESAIPEAVARVSDIDPSGMRLENASPSSVRTELHSLE